MNKRVIIELTIGLVIFAYIVYLAITWSVKPLLVLVALGALGVGGRHNND